MGMKRPRRAARTVLAVLAVLAASTAATAPAAPAAQAAATPYLGRWDVTLHAPGRDHSSWLDVQQHDGQLRVRMVGRWGHARWLPQAAIVNGRLRFVSPKEEEGRGNGDMAFEGALAGGRLQGTTTGPDGATWTWSAKRAPALPAVETQKWEQPIPLFTGADASAWTPLDANARQWQVADGELASPGAGTDLRTIAKFGDFKLHLEFNCAPGANSGVYLRGRYELQIENDRQPEAPHQRTAGIYGYLAPSTPAPRDAGVWHSYDVTMSGRYVTVVLDGKTVIDRQEIPGITGGALDSDEGADGPILLQGAEEGQVRFRNIVITPAAKKP